MKFNVEEIENIKKQMDDVISTAIRIKTDDEKQRILKAFDFAYKAHYPVRRKSGEPYILHPISVAKIVSDELMLGVTSIIVALLHDVVEDTEYTIDDILHFFGEEVATLVDGLTKMSGVFDHKSSLQAENFRKMFLGMSEDIRVVMIKLADRLHNMRTLESMPAHKQLKIAGETLFLYAPLAHRMGMYKIKVELEDIAFRYRHPNEYENIKSKLNGEQKNRDILVTRFSLPITNRLIDLGYDYEIKGRSKSIYSIWQKMQKKGVSYEQIFDLFAIRIIFKPIEKYGDEKQQCFQIYSIITDIYKPNHSRLRDWVNYPKANGYEALHATVMGPEGMSLEVQIRSERMNEIAELGYAAHWKYKGQRDQETGLSTWLKSVKDILESPYDSTFDMIDDIRLNLNNAEVLVFTPKGEVKQFPKGATVLDYAYDVHTDVGTHALYAEINHKQVHLFTELKGGDQVHIITSSKVFPDIKWKKHVVSIKARNAINSYFNKICKQNIENGKVFYLELLKSLDIKVNEKMLLKLYNNSGISNKTDLFVQLGTGKITIDEIRKLLKNRRSYKWVKFWTIKKEQPINGIPKATIDKKKLLNISDEDITDNYQIANCCNPLPGDVVMGYQDGQGIVHIHKTICPEAVKLSSEFGDKIVNVDWRSRHAIAFLGKIKVEGIDSAGIVHQITGVISQELNANIKYIRFRSDKGVFRGDIEIFVWDKKSLDDLISKLKSIDGVGNAYRNVGRK